MITGHGKGERGGRTYCAVPGKVAGGYAVNASPRFDPQAVPAFAAFAGVSPLEASSGRITRHRLNRFGDRELNRALHVIINWRMLHDPRTRDYLVRRHADQKTDPEIRRCLKRNAARQLFRLMETASTP